MRTMKKLVTTGIVVLILVAGSVTALAALRETTPAELVAGLTGREVHSVIEERRQTGKTYGTMANDAGMLSEFKEEMLELKKERLTARVADGTMTQEQADAIMAKIVSNQAVCDGSGAGCGQHMIGIGNGAGFGKGCHGQNVQGLKQGSHHGLGQNGRGLKQGNNHRQNGQGRGSCLRDGSCVNR